MMTQLHYSEYIIPTIDGAFVRGRLCPRGLLSLGQMSGNVKKDN